MDVLQQKVINQIAITSGRRGRSKPTSLFAKERKDEGSADVQKGCTQTEDCKETCLAHSVVQQLPTAGILRCLNVPIELPQLVEECFELAMLCNGKPGAHQCIEYGRKKEHIQYERGQVTPHMQQIEELHRIHQACGQHESVFPPTVLRRGIQHCKVSPNANIDCHQGDILELRHLQLTIFYSLSLYLYFYVFLPLH